MINVEWTIKISQGTKSKQFETLKEAKKHIDILLKSGVLNSLFVDGYVYWMNGVEIEKFIKDLQECKKIGRTFILDEKITFNDFKHKYNSEEYKPSWPADNNELGYVLTTGEENKSWWVSESFFKKNYEIVK